jgi:hypothetical protein
LNAVLEESYDTLKAGIISAAEIISRYFSLSVSRIVIRSIFNVAREKKQAAQQ